MNIRLIFLKERKKKKFSLSILSTFFLCVCVCKCARVFRYKSDQVEETLRSSFVSRVDI